MMMMMMDVMDDIRANGSNCRGKCEGEKGFSFWILEFGQLTATKQIAHRCEPVPPGT
jgi:hypothetical protein